MNKRLLLYAGVSFAVFLSMQLFFKSEPQKQPEDISAKSVDRTAERRYVLANPYQQVVLSNLGGSIAEVNLAHSNAMQPSLVKQVDLDAKMLQASAINNRFPLTAYEQWDRDSGSIVKQNHGHLGGFYPLMRRGVLGSNGEQDLLLHPQYYGASLIQQGKALVQPFELTKLTANEAQFEWSEGEKFIRKTFSISQPPSLTPYLIKVKVDTKGDLGQLWLTSGLLDTEPNAPADMLQYGLDRSGDVAAEKLDLPKDQSHIGSLTPRWISHSSGFFTVAMAPLSDVGAGFMAQLVEAEDAPSRTILIPEKTLAKVFKSTAAHKGINELREASQGGAPAYRELLPLLGRPGSTSIAMYAGPLEEGALAEASKAIALETGFNPRLENIKTLYGFFAFISAPFAKVMWWLMQAMHSFVGSWGFSLLLATVALRVALWPLNQWSLKSTAKLKALQPQLSEIQQRLSGNPQALMMERSALMKKHGVKQMAPMLAQLLQIPFIFGILELMRSTFAFRGTPFVPGWIDNLAMPDKLFSWGVQLPFIGDSLHLLPLALIGLMAWQMRQQGQAGNVDPQQAHTQKVMMVVMSGMLGLFFYSAPAGLNLYWLLSTAIGILQMKLANRQMGIGRSISEKIVPLIRR